MNLYKFELVVWAKDIAEAERIADLKLNGEAMRIHDASDIPSTWTKELIPFGANKSIEELLTDTKQPKVKIGDIVELDNDMDKRFLIMGINAPAIYIEENREVVFAVSVRHDGSVFDATIVEEPIPMSDFNGELSNLRKFLPDFEKFEIISD